MEDEWPSADLLNESVKGHVHCKPVKDRTEDEHNVERRQSLEISEYSVSEASALTGNASADHLSDRDRFSVCSLSSDKLDDRTFEGEQVDDRESDDESNWTDILEEEAERALERAHISHPPLFSDQSNTYGPNVTMLSSTSAESNQQFAIRSAARAIEQFPLNHMLAARSIKKQCEEHFVHPWHCVVGTGKLGVSSRNTEHISFLFKHSTVYMFKHESRAPNEVTIRRLNTQNAALTSVQIPDSVTVMANGMNNEKQEYAIRLAVHAVTKLAAEKDNNAIAESIVEGFEEVYGARFHCFVTDETLGHHVRYDPDNNIVFRLNDLWICLFKQNATDEDPLLTLQSVRERKDSGVLVPLETPRRQYTIDGGMDSAMVQQAMAMARKAITENTSVEKMAHEVRTQFEAQHGGRYQCVVATDNLGFCGHDEQKHSVQFAVDGLFVLLFRAQSIPAKDLRVTRYIPIGCAAPDIRVVSSGMTRPKERFAIDLASEGIQRFSSDKKRAAKHVVERFEERHGSPYHCAMSEGEMGFSVHHMAAMHFKIGSVAVFLFRNI